jgi:hypothetical protein
VEGNIDDEKEMSNQNGCTSPLSPGISDVAKGEQVEIKVC